MQNKIKVKGRASLGIKQLAHFMRIYSVSRTLFFDELDSGRVPATRAERMRKDPVTHLLNACDVDEIKEMWDQLRETVPSVAS
jgi:hypothetical protein